MNLAETVRATPSPHYLITKPRRFSYIVYYTRSVLAANRKNVEAKLLPVGVDVVNRVGFPQDAVDNYWLRRFHHQHRNRTQEKEVASALLPSTSRATT